jgi:hypothetical protein
MSIPTPIVPVGLFPNSATWLERGIEFPVQLVFINQSELLGELQTICENEIELRNKRKNEVIHAILQSIKI